MNEAIGKAMGKAMQDFVNQEEQESWQKQERVFYRITITQSTTADTHQVYGFTRKINTHTRECMSRINGQLMCVSDGSHLSEADALSMVRKGQGSVYKVTEQIERLK